MDKEEVQKLQSELESQLAILESESVEPKTHDMDDEDKLRLENLLLHKRLMEKEITELHSNFEARLIHKYSVDTKTETVKVDPEKGKIVVEKK